jgi:hypothetical protein
VKIKVGLHANRILYVQSPKKTGTVCEKFNFLSHKNFSNVTRNPFISKLMMFVCCPLIFLLSRQFHRRRLFFSLLVDLAVHVGNPGTFFAKAKPMFKVDFNIFTKGPLEAFCLKNIHEHPYFPLLRMFW